MKIFRALFVIAAVALAGASGDSEETSAEAAVGYAIISALAPSDEPADRAYDWQALGSRLGGPVYWHLAPPDQTRRGEVIHRTGWVQGHHDFAGAAACGGEDVRLLNFRLDGSEVVVMSRISKAFEESGVVLTQRGEDQLVTLQNFAPSLLRVSETCTSPHSAAMQYCWTNVQLALRAEDEAAFALQCRAP